MKKETIIGLFAFTIIVLFGAMTIKLGQISLTRKPTYTLYATFSNVSGLKDKAKVTVSGVVVGYVKGIELTPQGARVAMSIYTNYKIPKDSICSISTTGLLGETYIEITQGKSNVYLANNQSFVYAQSAVGLNNVMRGASEVLNQQNRDNLAKTLKNIAVLTANLNEVVNENRAALRAIIMDAKQVMLAFDRAVSNINETVLQSRPDLKAALENAKTSMGKLNSSLDNVYALTENVKEGKGTIGGLMTKDDIYNNINNATANINEISRKINEGKGTVGKLVNDEGVYDNLNSTLKDLKEYFGRMNRILVQANIQGNYLTRSGDSMGIVGANIYTAPDRFYRIEAVNEKDYKNTSNPSSQDTKTRITAVMGKRYNNIVIRGGIIESTFGVGADYYVTPNLKLTTDAFDFNHSNDIRDHNAQVRLQASYRILRHFYLYGGVNELLNSQSRSPFIGLGMEFTNEDLKYFAGAASSIPRN